MARASSAIASNPLVASARIVGPAPERQIPSNPGCVSGVIFDVTSGKPGICAARYAQMSSEPHGEMEEVKNYQFLTIGLVDAILHRLVDEVGVGRVCGEGGGEDGESLQVKYLQENVCEPRTKLGE
jgi:hypothetical protein